MLQLQKYKLTLQPAPPEVLVAVRQGVQVASFPASHAAQEVLGAPRPPANGVLRDTSGRVLVTCVTDLPGVTPAMIDWWFGWHLPSSERYALWHPKAHRKASVKEDRTNASDDRSKYIGNISYVDEYIGKQLVKLAIAFVPPSTFNLGDLEQQRATAICAFTSDRIMKAQGGCLVHYVVPTATGAQMRSGFWLGDIKLHNASIDRLLRGVLDSRWLRKSLVGDRMALALLQHCAEEMNHLARFLPALYADAHAADAQMTMQTPGQRTQPQAILAGG